MVKDKRYDIVVFGATGVTGQYVVDEVAKAATEEKLTWAVAGRNMSKLQKVLSESSKRVDHNVEETPIIIADINSYQSLVEMAEQCKVVLNCVGPYMLYGEVVVKACIEGGADHLDLSAEPEYLERMQLLYNQKAKESGVYIIGAAGVESITTEAGVHYTRKQFAGGLAGIERFITVGTGPKGLTMNTGTLKSIMHDSKSEVMNLRKSLFPDPLPEYEYHLPKRSPVFFSKEVNKWCVPFKFDHNTAVTRTMRDFLATKRLDKPFEFTSYCGVNSFLELVGMMMGLLILGIMTYFSLGRSLLTKFPGLFSFGYFKEGGPSREQVAQTTFTTTFVGYGYKEAVKDRVDKKPDKIVTTKIVGPEPAYVVTSICLVQSGVALLKEKDKLFHKVGGVFPPGAIFEDTTILERLDKCNIKFSIVE